MLHALKGKFVCEVLKRDKRLPSGLYLADRVDEKDNVARDIHTGNLLHFKSTGGRRFTYQDKKMISLFEDEVIAVEDDAGQIKALGSMVICKLRYDEKIGSLFIPDGAKQNSGSFMGEVVAIGEKFIDKDLHIGDEICYLRGEGYVFRKFYGNTRERLLAIKECWVYGKKEAL